MMEKRKKLRMRHGANGAKSIASLVGAIALSLVAVSHQGCGGRTSGGSQNDATTLPEECEAYLTTYRGCIATLGQPDIADQGVASMRASLVGAARTRSTAQQRAACVAAQQKVAASCR